jgi:hypothetical protein
MLASALNRRISHCSNAVLTSGITIAHCVREIYVVDSIRCFDDSKTYTEKSMKQL